MRPLLLLLVVTTASAQPAPEALLATWQQGWAAAIADAEAVRADESLTRTIDGPRGTRTITTRATLRLRPLLRPQRTTHAASIQGEPVDPDELAGLERRLRRALGPVATDLRRPAPLPSRVFASASPSGAVETDRLDGTLLWRLDLVRSLRRGPPERVSAWFTRSEEAPRLVRMHRIRPLRHRDVLTRTTTFSRVEGLDVPVSHSVEAEIEQKRRLRSYVLVLHAEARYSDLRVERADQEP